MLKLINRIKLFNLMKRLILSHKRLISWYQRKLKLSDYSLLWLVFFKGVIVTILIQQIFLN